jgi:hypothetical protein
MKNIMTEIENMTAGASVTALSQAEGKGTNKALDKVSAWPPRGFTEGCSAWLDRQGVKGDARLARLWRWPVADPRPAAELRRQADLLRDLADNAPTSVHRVELLHLAKEYDELAATRERAEKGHSGATAVLGRKTHEPMRRE